MRPLPLTSPAQPQATSQGALAGLALTVLLASLATSIANVALPTLSQALAAPFQQVQWVVLIYLLSITTLIISAGRLGDVFGRRRTLLAGIALFGAASLLCAFAPNLVWLIAARAIQGAGAALMMALAPASIGAATPQNRAGAAMGTLGAASAIGTALGPTLGGFLVETWGWPLIFASSAPLAVLAFILVAQNLPDDRPSLSASPSALDGIGTVLLALTIGAYALAMTVGRDAPALLGVAAFGLALFVIVETRVKSPLVRLSLLTAPRLSAGLAANALVATIMMATLVVGPFYLVAGLGLDAPQVGMVMSVGPLVAAFAGVPAGLIVDRFGSDRAATIGTTAIATGAFILSIMRTSSGVIGYVAPIAIMTAGYALFQAANNTGLIASAPSGERGVVSAMVGLARNLGLITGASALGAVFAATSGLSVLSALRPEAAATGLHVTFALAATLALTATAVIVFTTKSTRAKP